jgi:hypothetical protein
MLAEEQQGRMGLEQQLAVLREKLCQETAEGSHGYVSFQAAFQ